MSTFKLILGHHVIPARFIFANDIIPFSKVAEHTFFWKHLKVKQFLIHLRIRFSQAEVDSLSNLQNLAEKKRKKLLENGW